MQRIFGTCGIVFCLIFSVGAYGHQTNPAEAAAAAPPEAEPAQQVMTVQDLMDGVVKIGVRQAGVFSPSIGGGHGSGFLVGMDPKTGKGLIFTNRHVIAGNDLTAQSLTVEFPTEQRRPEVISGNVIFISRIHDFAVVAVDLTNLKRAKPRTLAMPSDKSPFSDFVANERQLRGQRVLSIGHPLDGTNISTYGEITGLMIDPMEGPYIQTQTPSNPGNSGGPLISMETGEVVGITSAGRPTADGVNYSIPIGVVLQEFMEWSAQVRDGVTPNLADPRANGVTMKSLTEAQAQALNLHALIEKSIPGYWNDHETVLTVINKNSVTRLEVDDVVLRMNGQVLGGHLYHLFRMIQASPLEAEYEVLRRGKVIKIKTHVANMAYGFKRRSVDYVYISGLFLQEMPDGARRITRPEMTSTVYVSGIVDSAETQFAGDSFPPPGSVVTAVKFGDKEYRIKNLLELKQALNLHRGEKMVLIRAHRSNIGFNQGGEGFIIRSQRNKTNLLDGPEDIFVVPMREVLTPMQFSLHRFKKQFSFAPDAADTRDWRAFVKRDRLPSACAQLLQSTK